METVLQQKQVWKRRESKKNEQKVGFFARLFRCRHKELTRPFTIGKESYRVCTNCGAHRNFDPETLETYGDFYFPVEVSLSQIELN